MREYKYEANQVELSTGQVKISTVLYVKVDDGRDTKKNGSLFSAW